jgi:hypothetical protein
MKHTTKNVTRASLAALLASGVLQAGEPASQLPPNARVGIIGDSITEQKALWDKDIAFRGPDTNDLVGSPDYRHDGVHFGPRGLLVHAERWYVALSTHYQWANLVTSQVR